MQSYRCSQCSTGDFTKQFLEEQKEGPLRNSSVLGAVPIGQNCYWWDYGQLKLYRQNVLLAKEDNAEAAIYRKFLKVAGLANGIGSDSTVNETAVKDSLVVLSRIGKGSVESSVLSKCNIGEVNVKNSVLVNVTAAKVEGEGLVLYNVSDNSEAGLVLEPGMPNPLPHRCLTTSIQNLCAVIATFLVERN